jgi:DNA-binding MarR family transcriptional regulator
MVDGYLGTMTTEERMLLHLFDNPLPEGQWEAPFTVTQAGISAAIHVQRKHVPRTLKRLEKRDELHSGQRHVPGAKQRRRVYGLTSKGKERAGDMRDNILAKSVLVNGESIILGTLRKGGQMTLDLLSHVDEGLVFHDSPVVSPVSNPEGTASLDAQAGESLVKRMFARAWEDGKITKDEQQLISEVVTFLGMHPERVERLSEEARKAQNAPPPEDVYRDMLRQALVDGEIVEDEIALLTTMRQAFGIDDENHLRILSEAKSDPVLDENTITYRATLKTALADGMITPDEDAMLKTLRNNLGISDSRHASLLAELLDKDE